MERLVEKHYATVYSVAMAALRDREAAEELTQETFLRAILHRENVRDPEALAAWLVAVTRNLARDWLRSCRNRSRLLPLVPLEPEMEDHAVDPAPRIDCRLAHEEECRLVRESVFKLPPQLRELVLLHYLEGIAQAEIAQRMGISPSNVSRQLSAALAQLRPLVDARIGNALSPLSSSTRSRKRAKALAIFIAGASPALLAPLREAAAASAEGAVCGSPEHGVPDGDFPRYGGSWPGSGPVGRFLDAARSHAKVLSVLGVSLTLLTLVILQKTPGNGSALTSNAYGDTTDGARPMREGDASFVQDGTPSVKTNVPGRREASVNQPLRPIEEFVAPKPQAEPVTLQPPQPTATATPTTTIPRIQDYKRHNTASGLLTGAATVSGAVYDVARRIPVPSLLVEIQFVRESNGPGGPPQLNGYTGPRKSVMVRSDQDGKFHIEGLVAGSYKLRLGRGGEKVWRSPLSANPNDPDFVIEDREAIQTVLEVYPGYTIRGQVLDKDSGSPLPGATVHNDRFDKPAHVISDAEGRFTFTGQRWNLDNRSDIWFPDLKASHPGYTAAPGKPLIVPKKPRPFNPDDLDLFATIEMIPERK